MKVTTAMTTAEGFVVYLVLFVFFSRSSVRFVALSSVVTFILGYS